MHRNTLVTCLILTTLVTHHHAAAQNTGSTEDSAPVKSFVNSLGMKMIFVSGGAFEAWNSSLSQRNADNEAGKHSSHIFALNRPRVPFHVSVDDYYMAQFTVTNGMYRLFIEESKHRAPHGRLMDFYWSSSAAAPWDLDDFKGDNLPVTGVQNSDIIAFCKWLTEKEGRTYRPAALYEFEYANRAGTDTRYWWGKRPDVRYMNYGISRIGHPTPVGSYPPNPWGFYDTHGNVWEYCKDGFRFSAMGGAFNSSQWLTGADAWGNFHEGPQKLRLLTSSFRLACDADQGAPRPTDLSTPTIVAARPEGPTYPKLKISVGERIDMGPIGTNATQFLLTRSGTWVVNNKRSTDQGKTWQPCQQLGEARCQLRDGMIVALGGNDSGGSPSHFDHMKGQSTINVLTSNDDWETVETFKAPLYVPLGRKFHPVRGLIELDDGRLLMTMYGWLDGDRIREDWPVTAFERDSVWIKTRVIVVESTDKGKSWRYLSTLSNNPHLGHEGQNETDFIRLPSGRLFAAIRTGIHGYRDPYGRENQDQPLLTAWSADNGKTWSDPQRIYVKGEKLITGIYPRVLVTEEGVLAVLRTRPDGSVIFSPDGEGSVWTDEVVIYPHGPIKPGVPYHAGMQDMALIGPNTILVVDVVSKSGFPPTGGWHAEGVPITIRKKK